jgi:integrase
MSTSSTPHLASTSWNTMRIQKVYIFRRYGFWYLRYSDSVLQPDGSIRRKQQCERLAPVNAEYPNERSVKQLAASFLAPVNAGEVDPQSTMRLADFISKVYLPEVSETLRRSTYKNYSDIARIHVIPRVGEISLRKFRTVDADRLLKDVAAKAETPDGEKLSHATLERIKAFLSCTFKTAKRVGAYDGANPVKDAATPKGKPSKPTNYYSEAEVRALLGAFPDEPVRTVLMLAANTGLRKSEIQGLLWRDLNGELLMVERTIVNGFSEAPKTDASKAPVPINRQLRKALADHRTRMGIWARDGFPIFQSEVHSPLNLANLVKRVIVSRLEQCIVCGKQDAEHTPATSHAYERNATLPKWTGWHSFRRGVATNLHAAGVPDKEIQNILRHSDIHVTMSSYVKSIPRSRVDAMEALGEKLAASDSAPSGDLTCTELAPSQASRPN